MLSERDVQLRKPNTPEKSVWGISKEVRRLRGVSKLKPICLKGNEREKGGGNYCAELVPKPLDTAFFLKAEFKWATGLDSAPWLRLLQ